MFEKTRRELIYRGQTRKQGEKVRIGDGARLPGNWVYGGVFAPDTEGSFSVIYAYESAEKYPVYAETVGQYTGWIDKKGTKIFEDDILLYHIENYDYIGVVFFSEGAYHVAHMTQNMAGQKATGRCRLARLLDVSRDFGGVEIVGNIHDTPELTMGF